MTDRDALPMITKYQSKKHWPIQRFRYQTFYGDEMLNYMRSYHSDSVKRDPESIKDNNKKVDTNVLYVQETLYSATPVLNILFVRSPCVQQYSKDKQVMLQAALCDGIHVKIYVDQQKGSFNS